MKTRYDTVHIALHWLIALLIFIAFPLGLYMADLKFSPTMLKLYAYHKWIGVTVFLLVAIRLGWRATHEVPPPVPGMPRWQEMVSIAVHHLLYLLMVAIPLSGWLMSSAHGVPTVWLGVLQIPDLLDKNKELAEVLEEVHETLNWILFALVAAHLGAALKHHFVDRDGLLNRMSFFSK
jgi:cytochrome b561